MNPEFEQVVVRTDERVVSKAVRFPDGAVFVPNCQIEEGDEVEVESKRFRVTQCEPHALQHRAGILDDADGCRLTLEPVAE